MLRHRVADVGEEEPQLVQRELTRAVGVGRRELLGQQKRQTTRTDEKWNELTANAQRIHAHPRAHTYAHTSIRLQSDAQSYTAVHPEARSHIRVICNTRTYARAHAQADGHDHTYACEGTAAYRPAHACRTLRRTDVRMRLADNAHADAQAQAQSYQRRRPHASTFPTHVEP